MNRILAIEPNAERGVRLRQLLRENLNTVLVISTSAHAAITAMTETRPDLILASTLLSANDEQDLVAHLRATPALRHLPVLTIPPVVETPAAETRSTGLISRLLRRPQPQVLFPMYDFGAVITRIEEALEQSKLAARQAEHEAAVAEEQAEEFIADLPAVESRVSDLAIDSPWLSNGSTKRAQRWALSDLPWLSSVKLPWGQHLRLVNISSSGLLVESGVRLAPGSETTFRIGGPDLSLVVPARVIRCRVATVDSLGVKYETAAAFDQPVNELIAAGEEPSDATMRLAELVAAVEARAESGASAAELRGDFESGVLKMVTAREVRLRDVPVVENDGRESVFFTIPTSDATPAILQVTFNANDQPSAADFELLTAAADIAVGVLPITGTTRQTSVHPRPHLAPPLRVISDHSTPRELQIA
jgi:CheY-like chemotaxis protein